MDAKQIHQHLAAITADLDQGCRPRRPVFALSTAALAAMGLGLSGCVDAIPPYGAPLYSAVMEHESDCDDGADEDGDGLTDCEDDDCVDACDTQTVYGMPDEICDNEVDDDGDELVDCDDDDCAEDPACLNVGAYGAPME
jgi:hypothetical protein